MNPRPGSQTPALWALPCASAGWRQRLARSCPCCCGGGGGGALTGAWSPVSRRDEAQRGGATDWPLSSVVTDRLVSPWGKSRLRVRTRMAPSPGHLSCTIHTKEKLPRSPPPVTPGLPPLRARETRDATTSAGRCRRIQGMGCRFTSGYPHSPLSMPIPVALRHAHMHPPMWLRVHPALQTPEPRHAVTCWAPPRHSWA